SNANFTVPLPFITGGSWKKSPVTTTWEPCRFRMSCPIRASLSKRSPSTMDTFAL
ncbi:uncharacterized protein TRAVEDRAFT_95470, partial [Trametes versicolor FP-101664 SS1]|uniref:uncharacterized protein n=1 Tax=Trametes versicolor (strain FP-101664) TaxID=717944 RepID=UPI0004621AAA